MKRSPGVLPSQHRRCHIPSVTTRGEAVCAWSQLELFGSSSSSSSRNYLHRDHSRQVHPELQLIKTVSLKGEGRQWVFPSRLRNRHVSCPAPYVPLSQDLQLEATSTHSSREKGIRKRVGRRQEENGVRSQCKMEGSEMPGCQKES